MKTLRLVFSLVILVILLLFSIFNAQLVQLTLFSYQSPNMPLFLVLIFTFFLGFLLAALFNAIKISLLRRQIKQLKKGLAEPKPEASSVAPPKPL